MEDMIKITGVDLVKFVQKVYDLSQPQGMGIIHFEAGELPEVDAQEIVKRGENDTVAISMDYVKGRACKMVVWRKDGELVIRDDWYDHSRYQLAKLLEQFGIELPEKSENAA